MPTAEYQTLRFATAFTQAQWACGQAHSTHTEEFYKVTESSFDLRELKAELLEWERTYNKIRPHQALDYMTPLKFLEQWKGKSRKRGEVSLITRTRAPSITGAHPTLVDSQKSIQKA